MPTPLRLARQRQLVTLGVLGAVVAGVALRFLTTSPLWLDEALSVRIASLPFGELGEALRQDGHPPLYYWLLHGWMEVFGDSDVAVRALSGVFSVLSLPLMWRVADRTGGPRVARWALVLLALSPFAVRYGTEARMYSLVMLLVLALLLLVEGVLRRPRARSVVALALVTGALLWTHYWALYLLAVVGGLLLLRWWRSPQARRATRWAIAGIAGGGLLLLPWLPSMLDQLQHTGTPWARPSRPTQVAQATLADLGGGGFSEALLLGTLLAIFMVAAFAQLDRAPGPTSGRGDVSPADVRLLAIGSGATMVVGSIVAWIFAGAYASRYGSVVAPFVLVVAAVGITRLRPSWLQASLAGVALVLSAASLGHNVFDQRTRADDVASAILADAGSDDLVVVCPDQLGPSLTRALEQQGGGDLRVVAYPDLSDPRRVDWRDYEERNDAARPGAVVREVLDLADGEPIWVAWSGGYRTLEDQCELLVGGLGDARGAVAGTPYTGAFEVQTLVRFG